MWDLDTAGHLMAGPVAVPDGRQVASCGEDNRACLWDAATGALTAEMRGHTSKVRRVAFRADGARLVTASADGTVRQWDVTTGREVESAYERHTAEVLAAAYSPDGRLIASGGTDRAVRVWQAAGRQDVAVLHGHARDVTGLAFSPDGGRLASASRAGAIAPVHGGDGSLLAERLGGLGDNVAGDRAQSFADRRLRAKGRTVVHAKFL